MEKRRIECMSVCLVLLLGLLLTPAWAAEKPKDYPNKPVTIQIGFGAGGPNDVGMRILADSLKKIIGQPVLAENKPGAGTQLMLTDFKNNAKPDGYTMAMVALPQLQTIVFDPTRKANFTMKDFQPVANQMMDPGLLIVRKESPYKTLEDLINDAKSRPGQVIASAAGIGGDDHLALLDVERRAKVKFNIIQLLDAATATARLLGGHTDVNADNVGGVLPMVKSGLARVLAVMMERRHPDLPNVPTFKERGFDVMSSSTRGYMFPAGTPMEIVRYMEQSIKKAMEDPDHIARMEQAGQTVKFMGIEEFSKFLESENERAKPLIGMYRK